MRPSELIPAYGVSFFLGFLAILFASVAGNGWGTVLPRLARGPVASNEIARDKVLEDSHDCSKCHIDKGITRSAIRDWQLSEHYEAGVGCAACHTRHVFSTAEAHRPQACTTCHMGFDHLQWKIYSPSKRGAICATEGAH